MSTEAIELWHKRARPAPTGVDFRVQIGCHFEEFVEMLQTLRFDGAENAAKMAQDSVYMLSHFLKTGLVKVEITDRKEFLDSIADQVVTGIGAAYCAGMKGAEACDRVNSSNWSKFDENGQPLRDENKKIKKGPNYKPPVLDGLY